MNLLPDLFSFAYVPGWYCQLDELAGLALPEPWRFRNPDYHTKNPDTPILERYIHSIFKKQVIDFNEERNPEKAADYLHVENEFVCFHTGLYTRRYKAVYGCWRTGAGSINRSLRRCSSWCRNTGAGGRSRGHIWTVILGISTAPPGGYIQTFCRLVRKRAASPPAIPTCRTARARTTTRWASAP